MGKLETTPFDAARYITEAEDVIDLLNDAFASGNAAYVAKALGAVARSQGMTKISATSGVNRQALYTALGEKGNPTLDTMLKVIAALGLKLKCEPSVSEAA